MTLRRLRSAGVRRFRELAERYCLLIEHRDERTIEEFLRQMHVLLPELYAAALSLPNVEESGRPAPEERVGVDVWRKLYDALGARLGGRNYYSEMFAPFDFSETAPVTGSLADDLVDIYLDLSRGLRLWRAGREHDAVWEWQFHFQFHWGEHATGALRALHALAYDHDWAEPNTESPAT